MQNSNSHREQSSHVCPVCSATGNDLRQTMIGRTQERAIMHVSCARCKHAVMLYSADSEMGTVTFGVLTDLHAAEARPTMQRDAISSDDVLAAHGYFQKAQVEAHRVQK